MNKLKQYIKATGLTNIGYALLFIAALILSLKFLAGAFLGIFIYINFNVIQKLVSEAYNKHKEDVNTR